MNFRKIFFYILVLLFFILLPLILFYAMGYRWDADTRTLTRTGLVALKTVPAGATIWLGNKRLAEKTPANITLVPGVYDLRLELRGYWPYAKKVEIRANKVSRLEHLLLFSKKPHIKSLAVTPDLDTFFLSPSGKHIFFVQDYKNGQKLYEYQAGEEVPQLMITLTPGRSLALKKIQASWALDEDAVLLEDGRSFYLLNLKNPAESFFLNSVLGFNPGAVKWSRRQPSTLYILQEGKLNRWDFKKKEIQPTALEKVADFQPTSFGLLWLQAGSNMLFQSDEEGKTAVRQNRLKNFKKKPPLLWVSSAKPFLSFEPEKWAALDKAGNFYVLNPSFYHAGVRGARFSPSGGKILFWTKDEIWLLEEESAEGGKEAPAKFKRRLVYESAVPILNAFWSSDENYAFFLTHRKLFVLELDPEGGANFYPYYSSKNSFFPKGWAVDEADGLFYFVADLKETRKLRVLRLAVGFLEPLVDHVEQMRKDVTAWTEKFQK